MFATATRSSSTRRRSFVLRLLLLPVLFAEVRERASKVGVVWRVRDKVKVEDVEGVREADGVRASRVLWALVLNKKEYKEDVPCDKRDLSMLVDIAHDVQLNRRAQDNLNGSRNEFRKSNSASAKRASALATSPSSHLTVRLFPRAPSYITLYFRASGFFLFIKRAMPR